MSVAPPMCGISWTALVIVAWEVWGRWLIAIAPGALPLPMAAECVAVVALCCAAGTSVPPLGK